MPYNLIICILIVFFAAFSQIMVLKAVRFGFKIAEKPEEAAREPIFHVEKPKKKPRMTPDEDRASQILANIRRYDGTSNGQIKVEVKR